MQGLSNWACFVMLISASGCDGDGAPAPHTTSASTPPAPTAPAPTAPAPTAPAATPPQDINVNALGNAVDGYDVTTYHTGQAPVVGSESFSHEWGGATWLFASAESRDQFIASPERFVPANGGYCTFGIVIRKKLDGDPNIWMMKDERLYLFLNEDVKAQFISNEAENLAKVAENWPLMAGKP